MTLRIRVISLLCFLSILNLGAVPARQGVFTVRQPDGRTLEIIVHGDEFGKITTTADGCAIVRQNDGYYCYARFDSEGRRFSTGYRAGRAAPDDVIARSRAIPYAQISRLRREMQVSSTTSRPLAQFIGPETKATEVFRGIVILAQFTDLKFSYTKANFESLLNTHNYSYNGATGCAVDYFNDQFEGKAKFAFDVSEIVTLSHECAYYGANDNDGIDQRAPDLVAEACKLVSGQVDFSKYDLDGDGEVENVFVFVPGTDEAEGGGEDHIWSHAWYVKDGARITCRVNGKLINRYAISTELGFNKSVKKYVFTGIGTFCHEFSHVLGLPDFYDTDNENSGGTAATVWKDISIMNGGCYNNNGNTPPNYGAIELEALGLGTCEPLSVGFTSLKPISQVKRYLKKEADVEGEFYLFEAREKEGWDLYIGGSGMIISHVDRSKRDAGYSDTYTHTLTAFERWTIYNEVNCRPDHQCADMVGSSVSGRSLSQMFWPYGSIDSFSSLTRPTFSFWSGEVSDVNISGITRTSEGVSFSVVGPLAITRTEAFQTAAIVQWEGSQSSIPCHLEWQSGSKKGSVTVRSYADGKYAYILQDLEPGAQYSISVCYEGQDDYKVSDSFKTKAYYSDGYAFIYLNSTNRASNTKAFIKDSQMPLQVFNAKNARSITWYFNNVKITPGASGYYTLTSEGQLKAEIVYNDGSTDIIAKKISFK